jgi:ribonuclease-3
MEIYDFQKRIGYFFKNPQLLETAFTHTTYAIEHNVESYQRLEFLGDAIVDFLVGEYLYKKHPHLNEGMMTHLRASLVCEEALSSLALKIGLDQYILLGNGAQSEGKQNNPSILADVFEAHLAAMYLDAGMENTRDYLFSLYGDEIDKVVIMGRQADYKTRLQEKMQQKGPCKITYEVISATGPVHDCVFEVEVVADGRVLGKGSANSKKKAQIAAAKDALSKME